MDTPTVLARFHYYTPDSDKRAFYSSKSEGGWDYMGYVDSGVKAGKYRDYMDYAGNKEKSSGVFDQNGLLNDEQKKQVREELRNSESVLWDGLISLEESYGKEKLKNWNDAQALLMKVLPQFFRTNNMMMENMTWFAGLHENTDNRHIHILFAEKKPIHFEPDTKKPRYHRGKLKQKSIDYLKVNVHQVLDSSEYYVHQLRNELVKRQNEQLRKVSEKAVYSKELKERLINLSRKVPDGNHGYGSKEMDEVRPEIDQLTSFMLTNDTMSMELFHKLKKKLKKRDEDTKRICMENKVNHKPYMLYSKFYQDLYRRCGNIILKYIRDSRDQKSSYSKGRTIKDRERWNEKAKRNWLLTKAMRLNALVANEQMDIFDEFMRKLEKAEYERLVEEGVIEAE